MMELSVAILGWRTEVQALQRAMWDGSGAPHHAPGFPLGLAQQNNIQLFIRALGTRYGYRASGVRVAVAFGFEIP